MQRSRSSTEENRSLRCWRKSIPLFCGLKSHLTWSDFWQVNRCLRDCDSKNWLKKSHTRYNYNLSISNEIRFLINNNFGFDRWEGKGKLNSSIEVRETNVWVKEHAQDRCPCRCRGCWSQIKVLSWSTLSSIFSSFNLILVNQKFGYWKLYFVVGKRSYYVDAYCRALEAIFRILIQRVCLHAKWFYGI